MSKILGYAADLSVGDWTAVVGLIMALIALVLGVVHNKRIKRIEKEICLPSGAPAVQIGWGNPSAGHLPCRITAVFNRVSDVTVTLGKEERAIVALERGHTQELSFDAVPEGTRCDLVFFDPVGRQKYKKQDIVRYGQTGMP